MAVEKWVAGAGVGLTDTTAFSTATLNSIANGSAILSDLQLDNSASLDIFMDIAMQLASITAAAPNIIGFYLYPLNQDATTYGDGRFGSSAAGPPAPETWVGNLSFPTGAATIKGRLLRVIMPPGKFKLVLYNQAGNPLAASGNNVYYRTYNRSVV